MYKTIEKGAGFVVYRFMVDELKLSGNLLLIYALLYSFSKSGLEYYGTQEYLAMRTGCARSTAAKALNSLLKAKLITKIYKKGSKTPIYTTSKENENKKKTNGDGFCDSVDFNTVSRSFSAEDTLVFGVKNKEIINNTSTSPSKSAYAKRENDGISFLRFGAEGLVTMTGSQHEALCNFLGDDMAEEYVRRLETFLIGNPAVCLKNHYRTILKWAAEDAAV